MLPVAIAFCSFIAILSIMIFIKYLKRNAAERQRLARAAAVARHMPGGVGAAYGYSNQIILTNGSAFGNQNNAIMLRHPPLEGGIKPFYDYPPPPYDIASDAVPPHLQARTSSQPSAPPSYNDLDILPGSIPSANIPLNEPLNRLQQNVLPQKR